MIDKILQYDPAIYHAIVAEEKRQQDTIELIQVKILQVRLVEPRWRLS